MVSTSPLPTTLDIRVRVGHTVDLIVDNSILVTDETSDESKQTLSMGLWVVRSVETSTVALERPPDFDTVNMQVNSYVTSILDGSYVPNTTMIQIASVELSESTLQQQ